MPKTAVVILNYNGRDHLARFLPPLIQNTGNATIIVADNRSTDDSLELLKPFPEVQTILLPQNFGYAGGYNEALKQIDATYFVLVNSDVEVTVGWLAPLEALLDSDPTIAAVQPKILDYNRREYFEYAGAAGGFIDRMGYPYCRGRVFDTIEKDTGQYDHPTDIFWASGACFIIRSDAFRKLGGFDPDFFAHMEEIDLCWRLKSYGHRVVYTPASTVYHVGGGTLNKSNPRKTYLNFRNGISLLVKNLPLSHLLFILPVRLLLDLAAGVKFWMDNKDATHFTAVLRACRDSIARLPRNFRKRSKTSGTGQSFSLIRAYFFKGKKTFSKLNNTK